MHHSCSRYGVASCFPSRGSSGSRGIQRVLPQYAIGEPIFPYLLVLSLCISKGHAQIVDESGRPVTPSARCRYTTPGPLPWITRTTRPFPVPVSPRSKSVEAMQENGHEAISCVVAG